MLVSRHFLIYFIGVILSSTYNFSFASPYDGVFSNQYPVNSVKVDKQTNNPWLRRMSMGREMPQQALPVFSGNNAPRFITEQELDALNNPFYSTNGGVYLHGWKPLPMLDGMGQRPNFGLQAYDRGYNQSYNDRLYRDSGNYGFSHSPWGNEATGYPVDSMNPGQFGFPFGEPLNGINAFIYE